MANALIKVNIIIYQIVSTFLLLYILSSMIYYTYIQRKKSLFIVGESQAAACFFPVESDRLLAQDREHRRTYAAGCQHPIGRGSQRSDNAREADRASD